MNEQEKLISSGKFYLIIAIVILTLCAAIYLVLKIISRKSQKQHEFSVGDMPELTIQYIKEWISTEIGEDSGMNVSIIEPSMIKTQAGKAAVVKFLPEELVKDEAKVMILLVRKNSEIVKIRALRYRELDNGLMSILSENDGIIKITKQKEEKQV